MTGGWMNHWSVAYAELLLQLVTSPASRGLAQNAASKLWKTNWNKKQVPKMMVFTSGDYGWKRSCRAWFSSSIHRWHYKLQPYTSGYSNTAASECNSHHLKNKSNHIQIVRMMVVNIEFNQKARQHTEAHTWHVYQTDYSKPGSSGLSA